MNYKIVDNFLPKENFIKIKELLLGNTFPWFYFPYISDLEKVSKGNLFYKHEPYSSFYDIIKNNLLNFMNIKSIIRVKANLYPNQSIKKLNEMHIDYDFKHNGAIFSINTNNGGTILEDGTKIDSIENRILFFDPFLSHDSENCTDQKVRVNININYF